MKYIAFLICLTLVQMPGPGFAEDRLETYRRLIGSSLEKKALRFARACILHELDPQNPVPETVIMLKGLPGTGLYLSLLRGRDVRVCIGSFSSCWKDMETAIRTLAGEVVYKDTRTLPLSLPEMKELHIVLSFVGALKEIMDPNTIDFTGEGLYVDQDGRGGVLLPGETRTLEYGLRRMIRQHKLNPEAPFRFASFRVVVFDERRH